MKLTMPTLLSFNAGYVDTAGFMALHGLFTAHVTGNFVTIGAALVLGTSGIVTKLLALPTFCVMVVLSRLLRYRLIDRGWPVLKTMLGLKLLLLTVGGVLAIRYGPFSHGDSWSAMITGLILVAGMAVQNALQRVHLGSAPPTTLMTGTTTQIMLDVGDLLQGVPAEQKEAIHARLARMGQAVFAFALGCAMAALLYAGVSTWCFALPPVLALAAYLHRDASSGG
ncbi:YoaK family protein [Dyella subtropica]|uniref:YoaK family protein n=1 Tax=Dyella subtropica TaxID=2992127 RepID=UPI00224D3F3E|nr:YoaK family protein [Dyella subtropica]